MEGVSLTGPGKEGDAAGGVGSSGLGTEGASPAGLCMEGRLTGVGTNGDAGELGPFGDPCGPACSVGGVSEGVPSTGFVGPEGRLTRFGDAGDGELGLLGDV
jgi:hypothetical protein